MLAYCTEKRGCLIINLLKFIISLIVGGVIGKVVYIFTEYKNEMTINQAFMYSLAIYVTGIMLGVMIGIAI